MNMTTYNNADPSLPFFRHTLATLAYRGRKAIVGVPDEFGSFKVGPSSRTPAAILAHIGDLLDWSLTILQGTPTWREKAPKTWDGDIKRFHDGLSTLDGFLVSGGAPVHSLESVFQGPIADALTHVGQLTMLRRLAGVPMRGENYFVADIVTGKVGPEQSPPRREFD
jgi:hypothetical protein